MVSAHGLGFLTTWWPGSKGKCPEGAQWNLSFVTSLRRNATSLVLHFIGQGSSKFLCRFNAQILPLNEKIPSLHGKNNMWGGVCIAATIFGKYNMPQARKEMEFFLLPKILL